MYFIPRLNEQTDNRETAILMAQMAAKFVTDGVPVLVWAPSYSVPVRLYVEADGTVTTVE